MIRAIKEHMEAACKDGIEDHEKAVLSAAEGVIVVDGDVDEARKCLDNRTAAARRQAAITSGNLDEAARIQTVIYRAETPRLEVGAALDQCVCKRRRRRDMWG